MASGRSDRTAAAVIFVLSALYVRLALTFRPFMRTEALGPATFPLLVGGLMLACSTALFVTSLRPAPGGTAPLSLKTYLPALLLWALLLGYSLSFDIFGFPLSTALFAFLAMLLLGVKPAWRGALIALAFTAAAWYLFTTLDVRLPIGEIFRR